MSPKLIVVFGATGQQGGSVAAALLLKPNEYKVRAITRNPDSAGAKALIEKGAECVAADLEKPDSLKAALEGAYGMFLVTAYMHDVATEVKQGKAVVDAAKAAGIEHLVFSGLENIVDVLKEECQHFDAKSQIVKYIENKGAPLVPYTIVKLAFFAENLITAMKPRKQGDEYAIDIPMGDIPMDMVAVAEIGGCVSAIFDSPAEHLGKEYGLSSDKLTIAKYAEILTEVSGTKTFIASPVTCEGMKQMGFPGCVELAVMFKFYQHRDFKRDAAKTRELYPGMPTFRQWAEKNKETINAME